MSRTGHILLIEDNPADALITLEAIKEAGIGGEVTILHSGEEADMFFSRQGQFVEAKMPELILLDLNLPGKDGREILADIKKDPVLGIIPVIVLTTSAAEQDVLSVYGLHANCYIVKPLSYDGMLATFERIADFWFGVVTLPSRG